MNLRHATAYITVTLSLLAAPSHAAEWQWSVPVTSVTSSEINGHPRAFLWVPPNCKRVRAVVVGQHNMLEEDILEHPAFRKTLGDLGIAEVWVTPFLNAVFRFDKGAGDDFNGMMNDLAQESGYGELKYAPIVPIGHSAAASYPWNFGAWNPGRTLAILSVHGDAPLTNMTGSGQPNPDWGDRTLDGVPGLMVMGEYEWLEGRIAPALNYEAKHPKAPVAMLADAANSHFGSSDELVGYLSLFLRKAAQYRLPAHAPLDAPVALTPVDPKSEWLVDRWRGQSPPTAPPAPYSQYMGDRANAFWCFDQETALATEKYYAGPRGKKPQLVGYVQGGHILPYNDPFAGVRIPFEPLADGVSFRLTGTFLDTVPAGNPEKWTGLPAGSPVGRASGGGPVVISRICGPVIQTGPDTFSIRYYRMGMDNVKRSNAIWLLAVHPGDAQYKKVEQQALLTIPLRNIKGAEQHITFPQLPDQKAGVKSLKLSATSDAGVPVYYYVREGPAEVTNDNTLTFTKIPPRAKFPVKITVVAWQYGRSIEPLLQSAEPITQTFSIVR
ncbi:MAG: hypothetical protein JWQ02_4457 [Capsulimonas sp.]|nr:hypothetical protein [Capsulimonas sp.]